MSVRPLVPPSEANGGVEREGEKQTSEVGENTRSGLTQVVTGEGGGS